MDSLKTILKDFLKIYVPLKLDVLTVMKNNFILGIYFVLLPFFGFANMASPIDPGALGSTPYTSTSVRVLNEYLKIKIDATFEYATYTVKYTIFAEKSGLQIPLLFYASEYVREFSVLVDGVPVETILTPERYVPADDNKFVDFDYFFKAREGEGEPCFIADRVGEGNNEFSVAIEDMLYFEVDLSEGEHIIELSYIGESWKDGSGLVNSYSFRYALSPAKYWKSFGNLTVELDASEFKKMVSTNLGNPTTGDVNEIATFEFNSIPTPVLYLSYVPQIDKRTLFFANIGPFYLALILGLLLVLLHIFRIIHYRKANLEIRFSRVVVLGSIFIPLVFVFSWFLGYEWIAYLIGEEAGQKGYTFLVVLLYPFIFLTYFLLTWSLDFAIKKKFTVKS